MKLPLQVEEGEENEQEENIIKNEDMKLLQVKDVENRENPYFMKNRKGDDITLLGILIAIDQ